VDDIWKQIAPLFDRPGPDPICSDSELISMTIIGECRGWNLETEILSQSTAGTMLSRGIPGFRPGDSFAASLSAFGLGLLLLNGPYCLLSKKSIDF
jgi:hypothetical protein